MKAWFYITYEKDPVLYMYQLLDDYKEGDLRIMPESSESPLTEREPGGVVDGLIGAMWNIPKKMAPNGLEWSFTKWKPNLCVFHQV